MHSHRLNDHPRIIAHTDGGQIDGLFYLHAPLDYQAIVQSNPPADADLLETQPGHAVIVVMMEQVLALSQLPGNPEDILNLTGPSRDHSRFDADVAAWFEDKPQPEIALHTVQVQRGELQEFCIEQMKNHVISQVEGMEAQPGQGAELMGLLVDLQRRTDKNWMSMVQHQVMDHATGPGTKAERGPRL